MTDLEEEEVKENARTEYVTRLRISEYDSKQDKSSSDSNKTGVSSEDEEDESESNLQKTNLEYTDEEQTDKFRFHSSHARSAKKNWAASTILSDDEDGHHDNSWVMKDSEEEEVKENVTSMEHLTSLRKSKYDNKQHKSNSDPNETVFSSEDKEDNDGVDELEINLQNTNLEHIDEDHTDHFRVHSSNTRSASDDEDSYDDNALICTLIRQHSSCVLTNLKEEVKEKENESRRYLTRLRKSESDNKQDKGSFDLSKPADSSDDEEDNNGVEESESNLYKTTLEYIDEDDTDEFRVRLSNARSAKRKWVAESDDEDDNALICTLNTQQSSRVRTDSEEEVKENVSRRRLTRLRQSESEDDEDNDGVDEPESEDASLDGFIKESSESVSNCDSKSSDSTHESEDALNEYKSTMDKIRRKKDPNMKWDLEGDMLSDFAKDPRLCMSAVCVLYRQQTADEKESKDTRYQNGRGFSQVDAFRGCQLAEFLTDGDSNGDLNKTVEELEEYDSEGIKRCEKLAKKYSNQLFKIYQNKEDPYFQPQY
ncbi:hypothetical protein Hdeb2414_s0016g00496191 [Helianthus debilis subsp. tardiflorus]